jgi:predicted RNase H-like nuclease
MRPFSSVNSGDQGDASSIVAMCPSGNSEHCADCPEIEPPQSPQCAILQKMRDVLIGFDSAWKDKNPGAISAYVLERGQYATFHPPRPARFGEAVHFIREAATEADYVLIAIDQPTIVPNYDRLRPVDRVAGGLVGKLGGGVQPARKGGAGAPMFGESAPIWSFLAAVSAKQNPIKARSATAGRFLMEVFPALALPAIVPEIWQRRRGAKYNPRNPKFNLCDWKIVASGVASFARRSLGAGALADWLEKQALIERPRKADQDLLDAAICLAIAQAWRKGPRKDTLLIGDEPTGYIATIVSPETREVLVTAAEKRGVDVDQVW